MLTKIKSANNGYEKSNYYLGYNPSDLFNNLFQNLENISFVKDKYFRYIAINDSFAKMLGLSKSKIIGKTDRELFDEKTAAVIRASDEEVISKKEKFNVEEIYLIKGKSLFIQISKIPLFDENKSCIGIGSIGNDITLQKQQNEEKETKRNKILSIIAHDLKNPFNSILGIAELLKSDFTNFTFTEVFQLINALDNSSKKAVELFDNLLNWTISSWRDEALVPEEVNLKSLVDQTILPLTLTAKDKDINIYNHVEENSNVFIDKNTICTIIRNLVNNSIKFTNLGGEIIIDATLTDKKIEIIISDNGIGMSDEEIESLFRADEKKSSIGTFNEKGVGLGLIVCKEFVKKNGGKIWAEKRKPIGSEFHFTIPLS